jgi:hypothetical protein
VQPIYNPGFTVIGAAEPLSIIALAVLPRSFPEGHLNILADRGCDLGQHADPPAILDTDSSG